MIGFSLGAIFSVAAGSASHLNLPGVIILSITAVACLAVYSKCSARPLWSKLIAFLLTMPILFACVGSWMRWFTFGLD